MTLDKFLDPLSVIRPQTAELTPRLPILDLREFWEKMFKQRINRDGRLQQLEDATKNIGLTLTVHIPRLLDLEPGQVWPIAIVPGTEPASLVTGILLKDAKPMEARAEISDLGTLRQELVAKGLLSNGRLEGVVALNISRDIIMSSRGKSERYLAIGVVGDDSDRKPLGMILCRGDKIPHRLLGNKDK